MFFLVHDLFNRLYIQYLDVLFSRTLNDCVSLIESGQVNKFL